MTGFEPVTFCTQNKRATKLRYIPFFLHCCTMLLYKSPVLFSTSLFSSLSIKKKKSSLFLFYFFFFVLYKYNIYIVNLKKEELFIRNAHQEEGISHLFFKNNQILSTDSLYIYILSFS